VPGLPDELAGSDANPPADLQRARREAGLGSGRGSGRAGQSKNEGGTKRRRKARSSAAGARGGRDKKGPDKKRGAGQGRQSVGAVSCFDVFD
jgi:hypothetical protein